MRPLQSIATRADKSLIRNSKFEIRNIFESSLSIPHSIFLFCFFLFLFFSRLLGIGSARAQIFTRTGEVDQVCEALGSFPVAETAQPVRLTVRTRR
jgi:hypothetical protein